MKHGDPDRSEHEGMHYIEQPRARPVEFRVGDSLAIKARSVIASEHQLGGPVEVHKRPRNCRPLVYLLYRIMHVVTWCLILDQNRKESLPGMHSNDRQTKARQDKKEGLVGEPT